MSDNSTRFENGTIYNNDKPIVEISSKYSTYSKQGTQKKEAISANNIAKSKESQQKASD